MPEPAVTDQLASALDDINRSERILGLFVSPIRAVANATIDLDRRVEQNAAETNARLGRLEEHAVGTNVRLDKVETRLGRVETRLDRVETTVDRLEEKVDGLDKRVDGLDRKFDGLDRKVDALGARLDAKIDKQVGLVRDDIRVLNARVETVLGWIMKDETTAGPGRATPA